MRLPPVYPAAIAVAYVLAVFASEAVPASDLVRPLAVALAIALFVQVLATLLLHDRDRGALVAAVMIAALPAQPIVFVALLSLIAFLTIPRRLALAHGRTAKPIPWASATRLLNLVALIALAISTGQLLVDGRLAPPGGIAEPIGPAVPDAPDIYVILLDGHPRWDTLAREFGYDSEPFLGAMEALGFEVARESRANYNVTELTLSSMFQMRQLRDIPEFAGVIAGEAHAQQNSLLAADLIAHAPGLDELHKHGYEVVGIPSEFTWVAPPADRSLGGGQVDDFEIGLLTESRLRMLAPDLVRSFVAAQHRDRILSAFHALSALADERSVGPRFVFAHIVSPHHPPVFGPGGAPRDGWSCFPSVCTFWIVGEPEGHDAEVGTVRDQVTYVDQLLLQTVGSIVAKSARPPVIVVMSDHGQRNDLSDSSEMLRSLLLTRMPGHPGLFPSDATPVNILPRILDAYAGAGIPLATEESYRTDMQPNAEHELFDPVPIDPNKPSP